MTVARFSKHTQHFGKTTLVPVACCWLHYTADFLKMCCHPDKNFVHARAVVRVYILQGKEGNGMLESVDHKNARWQRL